MNRKLARVVLASFEAERRGDVGEGLQLISRDFKVTEMYISRRKIFPSQSGNIVRRSIRKVYKIKGRQYEFKNVATNGKTVMVEFVESYPDPKTGKVYRTPLVGVYEISRGKIRRARHYCDPRISFKHLPKRRVDKAFR